jgi:hypothetical protein
METVYGIQIAEKDDSYVKIVEEALNGIAVASLPGSFMVDAFHFSKLLFKHHCLPTTDFQ